MFNVWVKDDIDLNQRRVRMNNPSSRHRLVSLTAGLLIALVAREMRTQRPTQNLAGISFENRQPRSGVNFVLNNGTTADKPISSASRLLYLSVIVRS